MSRFESPTPLRLEIVHRVATYISFLASNDETQKKLSIFSISEKPSLVSLRDYAWLLGLYLNVSLDSFVIAAIHATRLRHIITEDTAHLILLTATTIASKNHDSSPPTNEALATAGCVDVSDLKQMQNDLKKRLGDVHVTVDQDQFQIAALALTSCVSINDSQLAFSTISNCIDDECWEASPHVQLNKLVTPPPPPPEMTTTTTTTTATVSKPSAWAVVTDERCSPIRKGKRVSWPNQESDLEVRRRPVVFSPNSRKAPTPNIMQSSTSGSFSQSRAVTFPLHSGEGQIALLNDAMVACVQAREKASPKTPHRRPSWWRRPSKRMDSLKEDA